MTDRFAAALIDLRDALLAGDDVETALAETAEDAGLPVAALANRARTAYGDLSTYAARRAADAASTAANSAARREALEARAIREDAAVREFFRTYDFRTNSFRA